jgi:ankyrin repeat protein
LTLNGFLDAADKGDLAALQTGIDSGLDVNAKDSGGWTALLTAARAGQFEAVALLLDQGADAQAERPGGFGPLHLTLEAAKAGLEAEHLRIADALIAAGADPNQATTTGKQTPVRNAAALGLGPFLQVLLAAPGVDIDAPDKDKQTPLYAAADAGATSTLSLLLAAGADPNKPDRYGRTPLHAAAIVGNTDVARRLLEAGADPKAATRFPVDRLRAKSTPAKAAELLGHSSVAALLANAKARPKATTQAATPWPDATSEEARWLGRVLLGTESIPMSRDDRHVLDTVFQQWEAEKGRDRLARGFRGLLTSENIKLRSAAVHFYVKYLVPDDGAVQRAWSEHRDLYQGSRTSWYPETRDLAGLLSQALSRYSVGSESATGLVREQALTPGGATPVIAGLLASDRDWVLANIETLVANSPDCLPVLLGSARIRGLDPEDIMRRLLGRIPDDVLVAGIRSALPEWREWLDAVVAQASAPEAVPVEEPPSPLDEHRRLIGALLDNDASEVFDKLEQLPDTAPQLGEALLLEMASRRMDLRGAISLLRDRVERDELKAWIQASVPDELERLVYLAMI